MNQNQLSILVVEDDLPIQQLIATTLAAYHYVFCCVTDGQQAILKAATINPDIILLDLGLPDIDGVEVIEKIRTWSAVPIIVISARSEMNEKIMALDRGADDYLTKPFSVEELLARIRVVTRRLSMIQTEIPSSHFTNDELTIDFSSSCVYVSGKEIHLTPIEYKLICLLAKHAGKVLTHHFILKEVWGSHIQSDIASLRVFMATLRRKVEPGAGRSKFIQTHVGIGYRMLKY